MIRPTINFKNELVSALISPQVGLAVIGLVAFVLTIARPANLSLFQDSNNKETIHNEILANTQEVLDGLAKMEPSKLIAQGNIDEGLREAIKEVRQNPNDLRTLMCAGNIFIAFGDKDEGFKLLNKTLLMMPESRYVRLNYARRLYDSKRLDEAIEQYNILCKRFPTLWTEPHLELANIYIKANKPELAAAQYKIILGVTPQDVEMKKRYALALGAAGKEQEGFTSFSQACLAKGDDQNYSALAKSILTRNESSPKKAIRELKAEIASKPKQTAPRVAYVQLLLYLERAEEAKAVAEEVVNMEPQSPEAHVLLAQVALQLDDKTLALNEFRNIVKIVKSGHA